MSTRKLFGSMTAAPAAPGTEKRKQLKRRQSVQEVSKQVAWENWHDYHQYHGPTVAKIDEALSEHITAETTNFRTVPKTGVIYCSFRASQLGFSMENEEWANLGQGAPECGPLPNAPPRDLSVRLDDAILNEYAAVDGDRPLREAVAKYYNECFREGKESQYTYKNVCITAGGRSGLCRIMACLNHINVGFFLPDYTAYEELLACWGRISPIPILCTDPAKPYAFEDVKRSVVGHGLGAILVSNPSNPTGWLVEGEELQKWVDLCRESNTLYLADEFYSHYMFDGKGKKEGEPELFSSAGCVDDVNVDPVLIINGMTKNWRLPGWRVCWVVGPESYVEKLAAAGSFLDGGANHPLQRVAVPLLDVDFVKADALALQAHFQAKRDFCIERLTSMGFKVPHIPRATFYIWADCSGLPEPLNDGVAFFEEAIKAKVIVIPGIFFDVNPNRRRHVHQSEYLSFIRISCGPGMEQLKKGMEHLQTMVDHWRGVPPDTPASA